MRTLILASTSPYRKELLERLRIDFQTERPDVDETPMEGEAPLALAKRLALAKAQEVARRFPHALVIGSDQVADLLGSPLGKPGNHERARAQLQAMRGHSVVFHTAVALCCQDTGLVAESCAHVRVRLRSLAGENPLTDEEIERYLLAETPYDCAGSAKSEGLGIALLDAIESDDPTALIGLPLIRTTQLLRQAGFKIL